MDMEKEQKEQMETAQLRFGVIAPVIQGTYPDESIAAYCRRVSAVPMKLPDGRGVRYQPKTISKWINLYRHGGMEALMPKSRCDKGNSRVITPEAEEEIQRLKEKYPRLNATQIHGKLVQDGLLPYSVSVSSVQRYIKAHGLKGAQAGIQKDRKAFEAEYFGELWQADTCCLPYIRENGRNRRTYLMMVVDDHTRMIVGARLFYQDNAANFQAVLREAVSAYGIPEKLYADNGSPYANSQLSFICGSIGTVLLHTPVRDGASKGKVERSFRTMKERWLYGLDVRQVTSLEAFNQSLQGYVRQYNLTRHSTTGQPPLERFLQSNGHIRRPESREWLLECFHNRIVRKVNRDATVSIDSACYDVPMQFIGQKVEIRYLPGDMGDAYLLSKGSRYPLRATNRVENGRTRRENPVSIDYGKEGD